MPPGALGPGTRGVRGHLELQNQVAFLQEQLITQGERMAICAKRNRALERVVTQKEQAHNDILLVFDPENEAHINAIRFEAERKKP